MTRIIQPVIALQHITARATEIESSLRGYHVLLENVTEIETELRSLRIPRMNFDCTGRNDVIWHGITAVTALTSAINALDAAARGDDADFARRVMSGTAHLIASGLIHLLAPQCGYRLAQPATYWVKAPKEPAP